MGGLNCEVTYTGSCLCKTGYVLSHVFLKLPIQDLYFVNFNDLRGIIQYLPLKG